MEINVEHAWNKPRRKIMSRETISTIDSGVERSLRPHFSAAKEVTVVTILKSKYLDHECLKHKLILKYGKVSVE